MSLIEKKLDMPAYCNDKWDWIDMSFNNNINNICSSGTIVSKKFSTAALNINVFHPPDLVTSRFQI